MNSKERNALGRSNAQRANADQSDIRHGPDPCLMSADTLMGKDVFNQENVDLGVIKEIMVDMRSGRIG